jgi:hypothetical protein
MTVPKQREGESDEAFEARLIAWFAPRATAIIVALKFYRREHRQRRVDRRRDHFGDSVGPVLERRAACREPDGAQAMTRYKAVRFRVFDRERYFVIPIEAEITNLIIDGTMSEEVTAQCPTFGTAGNVAYAMNKTFGAS